MCGIIGYIGSRKAQPILLNSLSKLEYRGYDSCGIAVAQDGGIEIIKDTVRVKELAQAAPPLDGVLGIGHTRWATHGEPTPVNAHPHGDCSGRISVVHNGVINNFQQLREQMAAEGHTLLSQTDTEVIPHLIEKYYNGDLEQAVDRALRDIEGSYAIIVLMAGENRLVAARKDSPLIIGVGDGENFLASDVTAVLDYTSRVIYLEDGDMAVVTPDSVAVRHGGVMVERAEDKIQWTVQDAQKAGYDYFMLKEIHEQPKVIRDTLAEYFSAAEAAADLGVVGGRGTDIILILACGTSYHASLIGKYLIERLVDVPVRVELASEFNYSGQASERNRAIILSQSGETADALKAMRRLKEQGSQVIAITNVVGSTASRIADQVVYTRAGPEISVPATKSFIAQLIALYWLALPYARETRRFDELTAELRQLPGKVQQVLDNEAAVAEYAPQLAAYDNVFFVGRGINYPVALEGALKLKEISYIHAEGCAAGELKHGPFALLGPATPVIAVVAKDNTYDAMITGIKEIKARQSPVLALAEDGDENIGAVADTVLSVPRVDPIFSPVVNTVVMQLLSYFVARERGCSIDFPRNLAKSVTVE